MILADDTTVKSSKKKGIQIELAKIGYRQFSTKKIFAQPYPQMAMQSFIEPIIGEIHLLDDIAACKRMAELEDTFKDFI